MTDRLAGWVVTHARWLAAGIFLLSMLAAATLYDPRSGGFRLDIDPSVQALLPVSGEQQAYLQRLNDSFGETEAVMLALYFDEVFAADSLAAVDRVTRALQILPQVERLWSLATIPLVIGEDDDLDMQVVTRSGKDKAAMREAIRSNPLYSHSLLSVDGNATGLIIYLREQAGQAGGEQKLLDDIKAAVRRAAPDVRMRLAGPPVLKAATSEALLRQLSRILPGIMLFIAVFLAVGFRSLRAVFIPLTTLALALLWTLALIIHSGRELNLITAIVPPVVVTIGLAYSLHVLTAILRHADQPEPVRQALSEVILPLLMTAATTASGFLALMLSPLASVREFAWLAATGIVLAALFALTVLPALFVLSGCKDLRPAPGRVLFRRAAVRLGHFNARHRSAILITGGLVCAISLVGTLGIRANTDYVTSFAEDVPVRMDFETINRDFSGATPLSIMLESSQPGGFARPQALAEIAELQEWLARQPEVGYSRSAADYLKVLNRGLHGGDQAYFAIPDSAAAVRQILAFGGGDALAAFLNRSFSRAHILVNVKVSDSAAIADLARRINHQIEVSGLDAQGRVTGTPVLISEAVAEISGGQLLTVGVAFLAVFLLLSALFTSARAGLLALLPNVIPVLVYFGVLGFAGIPLNPTTSLVACIVLGIAVDDTLFYFARFNADARRMASESKATVSALRSVIRPVTYTSAALVVGFLGLSLSGLQNQAQFGALAAFTLAVAWIVDISFTPALASKVRIVTLWDVLRLDLGDSPQASIPLFADLSLRQARIFALLSRIQMTRAGQRIMSDGDQAGDIFVIIDGELKVWVEREGQTLELAQLGRGAVLGEVGHFGNRRTANVDAVSDGRLLRFDSVDLERLRLRYPRTAALVLRNLNRIQAERLAQATQRLR